MSDLVDSWIKHHLLLRIPTQPGIAERKKNIILVLYNIALRGRNIPAAPYVYNSHQADIRQIPELHAIICDILFWDISGLVASSFYVAPTHDIVRLADALLANSLLCHGKANLSLEYAHKFANGPYTAAFNAFSSMGVHKKIVSSTQLQTSFALLHEIAHFECDDPSNALANSYRKSFADIVDSQNSTAEYINGIDLTAIAPYLDKIDINELLSLPLTENGMEPLFKAISQIRSILLQYGHLVETPGISGEERRRVLVLACDNYLHGQKAKMIDGDIFITEGTCDLLALSELLDFGCPGLNKTEARKMCIDAYTLSLLTLDLIQGAMNAPKYTKGNGYDYMDTIYMRREKEKQLLPMVLMVYSHTHDEGLPPSEIDMLCEHFSNTARICDAMYAEFCDYVFSKDFIEKTFIPHGSPEWFKIYTEIDRLLQYPV